MADDSAAGWRLCVQARQGSDLETQRRQFLDAIELARRAGDDDLECEATASLGIMLVFSGHVEEGMEYLDRALAAICGGGVRELPVVEGCLCGLFNTCERTHDVDRAQQWLRAAEPVIRRGNSSPWPVTAARTTPASSSLLASGRTRRPSFVAPSSCSPIALSFSSQRHVGFADVRLRQGRLEEAEALLDGLEHHDDAVVTLAWLT